MKILTVCDEGNNRSVNFAHLLKYWNNDCIAVGLLRNSNETLDMLFDWADLIILTEKIQSMSIPLKYADKVHTFDVGPDTYPRPFNKVLNAKVRKYLDDNKALLKG